MRKCFGLRPRAFLNCDPHPTVLLPPAVVGLLRYPQLPADLGNRVLLIKENLRLPEYSDNLLRGEPLLAHIYLP